MGCASLGAGTVQVQCARILCTFKICEFEILRCKHISKDSLYAQNFKQCESKCLSVETNQFSTSVA
jgi:hypothetical protein